MKTLELEKDGNGAWSKLKNGLAKAKSALNDKYVAAGAVVGVAMSSPAYAADPVYTGPFAAILEALDMTAMEADLVIAYTGLFLIFCLGLGFTFMMRRSRQVVR